MSADTSAHPHTPGPNYIGAALFQQSLIKSLYIYQHLVCDFSHIVSFNTSSICLTNMN
jgi:hypothetical protein